MISLLMQENPMDKIKLTQFSKGSGCGCKISPAALDKILPQIEKNQFPGLLVGYESKDDAAVYENENGDCIISTTDFFTPIVDDPYEFGRIAAANALSDVYAMGGKPLMALSILGWPVEKIPSEVAKKVIEGGRSVCKEAGIPLAGGHSIDISEPVFGLSVTGQVKKNAVKRNNTPKKEDVIFLTKPLGSGVLSSALKRGLLQEEQILHLTHHLTALNAIGENLGQIAEVSAMTDVTGFGLLGHLLEMTGTNKCSAIINKSSVPRMDGFEHFSSQFVFPENTTRNFSAYSEKCEGLQDLDFLLFCDPQTNGGLLFTAEESIKGKILNLFESQQQPIWEIGRMVSVMERSVIFR